MTPIILLLLLPVLTGTVLLLLVRSDRRRQFVEQRLTKMTVGRIAVNLRRCRWFEGCTLRLRM
jgi:hypothetical protein